MESEHSQFVVQEHSRQGEPTHWDLMLQEGPVLQTYRLALPPAQLLHETTTATRISDHPFRFLTYEGTVNKGLGSVRIVDSGTYELLSQSDVLTELEFSGRIIKGRFYLAHTEGDVLEFGRCQEGHG